MRVRRRSIAGIAMSGLRMRIVIVPVLACPVVLPERHALPGGHGRRTLEGYEDRQHRDQQQPGKLERHE